MANIIVRTYSSPCGRLLLGQWLDQLCMCDWLDSRSHARIVARLQRQLAATTVERQTPLLDAAAHQLDEYFNGQRSDFDLPLQLVGTEFQCRVWRQLLTLPYGTTTSYAALAASLAAPKAVRAVANAVGANPLSIVVPCHRVIGSNGSITGYGGGLAAKSALLTLEQSHQRLIANHMQ